MKRTYLLIIVSCLITLTGIAYSNDNQVWKIDKAYFCAICELVDIPDQEKELVVADPLVNFFHLRPIKIYWGSLKGTDSALMFHPLLKKQKKTLLLVYLYSPSDGFIPGDSLSSFIPIQSVDTPQSWYRFPGESLVSEEKLREMLDAQSKKMLMKYPTDVEP